MDAEFKPVAKSTLSDEVAQRVTQLIQGGSYEAGDRLPTINEMARRFGVGHPTLREALKKLETLGVVEIKHGSGVYVQDYQDTLLMSNPIFAGEVSKKLMLDLIEARMSIEFETAGLAAEHATDQHIERMQELLAQAGELLQKGEEHRDDDAALSTTNMAFHREIAVASGNAVLAQILEVLSNLFGREQRIILDIHGSREKDHTEHLGILEALRARDTALAEQRMREHLEGVREVLLQWDPDEHPLP